MKTRILDLITAKPGLTLGEICHILSYEVSTTASLIRELVRDGQVTRRLSPKGRLQRHYIVSNEDTGILEESRLYA